jgi:hypothetical protein
MNFQGQNCVAKVRIDINSILLLLLEMLSPLDGLVVVILLFVFRITPSLSFLNSKCFEISSSFRWINCAHNSNNVSLESMVLDPSLSVATNLTIDDTICKSMKIGDVVTTDSDGCIDIVELAVGADNDNDTFRR